MRGAAGIVTCCRLARGLRGVAGVVWAAARAVAGGQRQPSRRKPSRMEVLDEFDSEFPQTVTFCQLISEEDFERQAATYTERALRRLFRSLDRNPALAERVMPRGGGGSGNRRNQNASSRRTARPPHACSQPCCRLDHRCCRRPPRRPRHPLSTLCPRSLAPSLRCPAHRSVARGRASSAPCSEALQRFPGPTLEEVEVSRSEVKLNWTGLSSNPKSHTVDLTPLVLSPGGFHFSYLTRNNAHKLQVPWTSVCRSPAAPEETPSSSVRASIFTPPVLLKFQPVPRPTGDSENDPGNAESVPHQREQSPLLYRPRPEDE
ncbi:uncharacterized protein [Bos taurus]|uniref:uncharacterized protein isoform X6 n=1 Tax=Bos taurus TaxID=9913 RepID=UPI0028CB7B16|nr:uncharacterized protein LOC101905136 isoform X6 [Bos taurus]